MIHREFVLEFYKHLFRDEQGRYLIRWAGRLCEVDVEDTPLVIRHIEVTKADGKEVVTVYLNDDTEEVLDTDSLWIGKENVLYAMVRQGALPARFLRPAYYSLAGLMEYDESKGDYTITLNGEKHSLPLHGQPAP